MNRRTFLRSALASGLFVATPEPVRRFWQVGRNAPIGVGDVGPVWTASGHSFGPFGHVVIYNDTGVQEIQTVEDAELLYGKGSMQVDLVRMGLQRTTRVESVTIDVRTYDVPIGEQDIALAGCS